MTAAEPAGAAFTDGGPVPGDPAGAAPLRWLPVCRYDQLLPERGVCALVSGRQVALFRLADGSLYALSNYDPFSRTYVLSRGIVGSRGEAPTVASPMYKQVFDLRTGVCLDDDARTVPAYPVRRRDGVVEVGVPARAA